MPISASCLGTCALFFFVLPTYITNLTEQSELNKYSIGDTGSVWQSCTAITRVHRLWIVDGPLDIEVSCGIRML